MTTDLRTIEDARADGHRAAGRYTLARRRSVHAKILANSDSGAAIREGMDERDLVIFNRFFETLDAFGYADYGTTDFEYERAMAFRRAFWGEA